MIENISDSSVRRLSAYLRQLEHFSADGVAVVSSQLLARRMNVGDAMIRRDLALFGQFGRPGVGYDVDQLTANLRKILGTNMRWNTVILGAGKLSRALMEYPGFHERGFEIVAAFDIDPRKVDTKVGDIPIHHMDELETILAQCQARIAILTVPAEVAQQVTDRLAGAGIDGILNFATTHLETPQGIHIDQVDITAHLEQLSFHATNAIP